MKKYIIITDSTCDLPQTIIDKNNIKVIPYELTFNGENYFSSTEINYKDFYKELRNGTLPKTTQINSTKFIEYFEPLLKSGQDILYICFSSALSGTYASALNAAQELNELYDNKVFVVDSKSATLGQGLLVFKALEKQREGYSIKDLEKWLNENNTRLYHVATVNDLFHLKRGGRISSSAAVVGSMLNIKPLIKITPGGALESFGKVRGRKASIMALINNMEENMILEENSTIFIAHADCLDDANFLASEIKNRFNIKNFVINYIGPIIGSHIGPEALAVFYWANSR